MIEQIIHPTRRIQAVIPFLAALTLMTGLGSHVLAQQERDRTRTRVDSEGIPRVLSGLSEASRGLPLPQAATSYLQGQKELLRLDGISLNTIDAEVLTGEHGSRISIAQNVDGIPVFRGGVVIFASGDNEIRMVTNNLVYGIDLESRTAEISSDQAVGIALGHLAPTGASLGEPRASLFVVRIPGGADRLAYRVIAALAKPYGDWEVFVDAQTGKVLSVRDQFVQAHPTEYVQGLGAVYRSDPLSEVRGTYGDPGLVDNDDADSDLLSSARTIVWLDSLAVVNGLITLAGPFCTVADIEAPVDSPSYAESSADAFRYTRSQPGFEAVMVYYHAVSAYRRLQELGFEIPRLRSLRLDPHGYQGQDNSHYSPSGNWISFGTGGVDDAEDADVIWHEYGHAIVYSLIPYWGGGEAGALGEGYSDYWAASHSRSLGQWQPGEAPFNWIFRWDGHNTFWSGRILNASGTYPFGSLGIHASGQVWASALMGIHGALGRDITDRLVLGSLFYLGSSPTGEDAALALLQADSDIYGGKHAATLVYWLGTVKKFLPADPKMRILVIADDGVVPADTQRVDLAQQPPVVTVQPDYRAFSNIMPSLAAPEGYAIQPTSFASLDTTDLEGSALVVLIGGLNPRPFDDPLKRAAIVGYVARGGKVLIEGGEVGFVYASRQGRELDSDFRRHVMHFGEHGGDLLGAPFLSDASPTPIFTSPHAIVPILEFREPSSFAQRDLNLPDPSDPTTIVVGAWAGEPGRGGMLLHCSSGGGASLLVPFSFSSLSDSIQACKLVENLLSFMVSPTVPTTPVVEQRETLPAGLVLHQNYPNPFNPSTTIRFELGGGAAEYVVRVEVFDELGRLVSTPVEGTLGRGVHEVRFDASALPSGAYFYRLFASDRLGNNSAPLIRRMLLVR